MAVLDTVLGFLHSLSAWECSLRRSSAASWSNAHAGHSPLERLAMHSHAGAWERVCLQGLNVPGSTVANPILRELNSYQANLIEEIEPQRRRGRKGRKGRSVGLQRSHRAVFSRSSLRPLRLCGLYKINDVRMYLMRASPRMAVEADKVSSPAAASAP